MGGVALPGHPGRLPAGPPGGSLQSIQPLGIAPSGRDRLVYMYDQSAHVDAAVSVDGNCNRG